MLVFGEPENPGAYYLTVEKAAPAYYSAIGIKPYWQIDFNRERINFTATEIELMKNWELNLNWETCVLLDETVGRHRLDQQVTPEAKPIKFKKIDEELVN